MKKKIIFMIMTLGLSLNLFAEPTARNSWDGANNPSIFGDNLERRFDKLPTVSIPVVEGYNWPEFYWASRRGGIAHRWTSENPNNFKYKSPSLMALKSMSKDAINTLSPAEKFDIYNGRYDYPSVQEAWNNSSSRARDWAGICHGVAPASLHHKEPKTVTVYNKDGIELTFYSSDLKGLISNYYAFKATNGISQLGKRCFVNSKIPIFNSSKGCNDVNAGAFHIVLGNRLGLNGEGLIADIDRYNQVWNHSFISYKAEVYASFGKGSDSPKGTVKRVSVRNSVVYTANVEPSREPVIGTENAKYVTHDYEYILDLDSKGEIIGGEWISEIRPDFIWYQEEVPFEGYFSTIKEIYVPAL